MATKKTYSDKLKSPHWQKKRLQVFNRDKFTCKLCGDTETTLNVHHKSYENNKEPWDYNLNNFITLCEDCHSYINLRGYKPDCVNYIKLIKMKNNILNCHSIWERIPKDDEGLEVLLCIHFEDKKVVSFLNIGALSLEKVKKLINNG